jgi:hypothetical protein
MSKFKEIGSKEKIIKLVKTQKVLVSNKVQQ